ncbi:hypothetical protein ACQ4M3_14850 [Leptolyngbya sp. AN03gr2]|uniref:hypothetical protein n=1 Tax=unclassified Leptolyngbya TaxID=2650499 RepID=UPI003D316028
MNLPFALSPRYRLDDEMVWLEGIDPSRCYWIRVNSQDDLIVAIPGLSVDSMDEFKSVIRQFRSLQPGMQIHVIRAAEQCEIHCVSENCYAIEATVLGSPVWHLFDRETLESLLMTAHPDWCCSPKDVDLGRRMLARCWQQAIAV